MTLSSVLSTLAVLWLIIEYGNLSSVEAIRLLGWWPLYFREIGQSLLLTAIFFAGPLFERGIAEGGWRDWFRPSSFTESLLGWIGWRNYVAVRTPVKSRFILLIVPGTHD